MRWSQAQLDEYLRKQKARAGDKKVRAAKPERIEGVSLECAASGESEGRNGVEARFNIKFTVCSVRPLDWDNLRLKELQDCLVQAGLLPDDNWRILQGCVISKKAHSKEEEKTIVEIENLTPISQREAETRNGTD